MKKTILSDIWRIRGEFDVALLKGDASKILALKEEYEKLIEDKNYLDEVFDAYGDGRRTVTKKKDVLAVYKKEIAVDLDWAYKKIVSPEQCLKGKKVDVFGTKSTLVSDIWSIRASYDDFLLNATNSKSYDEKENMALGKEILERLYNLKVKNLYLPEIKSFIKEVKEAYINFYGNKTLRQEEFE